MKAIEVGFFEGIHIDGSRSEDTLILHLLFANDTLIFCKP